MVRFLVESGYTVFCMSWRNPDAGMQDIGFDDYLEQGLFEALEAVGAVTGGARIHAAGYCLGGTLLSIGAAAMARDGDARLASLTLFCAQTDFADAGELQTFTTEDQVAFLEELMSAQGYLEGDQMGEAFKHLRSRDLIWSSMIKSYWLGEADQPNDLMTWNADATRMPARMHSEYLRRFFLHNDLVEGRFEARGRPVALTDIQAPMFLVGTETDHVAPWRSVYKAHLFTRSAITFVLASGGHNAGVVSEPGHPRRHYSIRTHEPDAAFIGPAPGTYVLQR
jgi:polyhydroxyalkanoate synthase